MTGANHLTRSLGHDWYVNLRIPLCAAEGYTPGKPSTDRSCELTYAKYKPYVIDAGYLLPPSLADFLGTEDEVHIFREVTEHLGIECLDSDFNGMGQHPYHPRMLLRLLMWGMANRVVSTRRIEVMARRDVSFIYLSGGGNPDYRTLARFRRRNAAAITELFKETVLLCARLRYGESGAYRPGWDQAKG
jgi:transposase